MATVELGAQIVATVATVELGAQTVATVELGAQTVHCRARVICVFFSESPLLEFHCVRTILAS